MKIKRDAMICDRIEFTSLRKIACFGYLKQRKFSIRKRDLSEVRKIGVVKAAICAIVSFNFFSVIICHIF